MRVEITSERPVHTSKGKMPAPLRVTVPDEEGQALIDKGLARRARGRVPNRDKVSPFVLSTTGLVGPGADEDQVDDTPEQGDILGAETENPGVQWSRPDDDDT